MPPVREPEVQGGWIRQRERGGCHTTGRANASEGLRPNGNPSPVRGRGLGEEERGGKERGREGGEYICARLCACGRMHVYEYVPVHAFT